MAGQGRGISLDEKVRVSSARQVSMVLPQVVSEHLDRMVESVVEVGGHVRRQELVAALIATCELDGQHLDELLHRYRTMKVRDVPSMAAQADGSVVLLEEHRPGPRVSRP